ncbi:CCA tRNA nucleotidyltransferase [Profundibacter sp.]|uniref:CCA tRNA nucleotidyltransferase n=1 Tax=Profundibacter sp. TaxID=3101071 RepID=UPI003D0E1443
MTQITADWITDPHTQQVCEMLTGAGYECYFVGGCVRNALLDVPVNDIDISTNARPDRLIELATAAGLKSVPTGIDHGTVTVVAGGTPYEITTYRRDVETDGRRAVVDFADSITDDALRRDFTMNALYADQDGVVVDPLNGLPDLVARRVRFIEDADRRIKEDYLRILRFFRFHAWYGDVHAGLDAEGLAACAANLAGLETLSKERIGSEVKKLLAAADPAPSTASMGASGVLNTILPGADAKYLPVLVHLEQQTGTPPDPIRRLAVLGGEDVKTMLRLSNAEAKQLAQLRKGIGSSQNPAVLGYYLGADMARDVILLRAVLMEAPLDETAFEQAKTGATAQFPIKAADLMPACQGAALGKKLKDLERKWVASGFALGKEQLLGISKDQST